MKNGCDDLVSRIDRLVDRYQVPPSVEIGCSPYSFITFDRNRSATDIFLSFDIFNLRTSLLSGSMATQNQIN